jgi:RNA polymerase sigma-70 factor, ECF subfamily
MSSSLGWRLEMRAHFGKSFASMTRGYAGWRGCMSATRSPTMSSRTWIVVIRGIASFQERSSLKTWVYGILVNVARRRAQREGRTVPFASVGTGDSAWGGTVDLARLHHPDLGVGYWPSAPTWARDPAGAALDAEAREVVLRALRGLVPAQREVMTLRDVEGWSGAEVAEVLGISDVNQRTLLHRARVTVRAALEEYFNG